MYSTLNTIIFFTLNTMTLVLIILGLFNTLDTMTFCTL